MRIAVSNSKKFAVMDRDPNLVTLGRTAFLFARTVMFSQHWRRVDFSMVTCALATLALIALNQLAQAATYGNWTTDFSHSDACIAELRGTGNLDIYYGINGINLIIYLYKDSWRIPSNSRSVRSIMQVDRREIVLIGYSTRLPNGPNSVRILVPSTDTSEDRKFFDMLASGSAVRVVLPDTNEPALEANLDGSRTALYAISNCITALTSDSRLLEVMAHFAARKSRCGSAGPARGFCASVATAPRSGRPARCPNRALQPLCVE